MTLPDYLLEAIKETRYQRVIYDYTTLLRPTQQEIYDSDARYRVVACGRRWGKTEVGKRIIIDKTKAGEYWWWVSPTYKMALDAWGELIALSRGQRSGLNKSNREITFPSGGRFRVLSGHEPEDLRGSGLDGIVIDEAAYCSEQVWHVLRPALSDKQGKAIFLSTPKGRNWFFQLYQRGLDPLQLEWASWQMPSSDNPIITLAEVNTARDIMPERRYLEEYAAVFSDDYGMVFRGVLEVATAQPSEPQHPGGNYVMGVDWGRVNDFTVICVLDKDMMTMVWQERFNQIDWTLQRGRLRVLYDRYRPTSIVAEANSIGEPNIEELRKEGMPVRGFQATQSSKAQIIDALALAIERQEIRLLNDPVLIAELQSYEMERLPGGGWRYNASSGGHDDCVIALALAYSAVGQGTGIWF